MRDHKGKKRRLGWGSVSFLRRKMFQGLRYILWTTKTELIFLFCFSLHVLCWYLVAGWWHTDQEEQVSSGAEVMWPSQAVCTEWQVKLLPVCCHEDLSVRLFRPGQYCCLACPRAAWAHQMFEVSWRALLSHSGGWRRQNHLLSGCQFSPFIRKPFTTPWGVT